MDVDDTECLLEERHKRHTPMKYELAEMNHEFEVYLNITDIYGTAKKTWQILNSQQPSLPMRSGT